MEDMFDSDAGRMLHVVVISVHCDMISKSRNFRFPNIVLQVHEKFTVGVAIAVEERNMVGTYRSCCRRGPWLSSVAVDDGVFAVSKFEHLEWFSLSKNPSSGSGDPWASSLLTHVSLNTRWYSTVTFLSNQKLRGIYLLLFDQRL